MSIHQGHRQRLKERFCREGLDNFDDLYILELLLFYTVSRKDTNELAHRLLDRFGSLRHVLEANREELVKVDGVGEHTAVFLSLIRDVGRRYRMLGDREPVILSSLSQCGEYMKPYFFGRNVETVFLLCLDAKGKVLCCRKVGEGSVNSAGVPVRRIVEIALLENATSVVLAHNHPSGLAIPSADDIQTTHRVSQALQTVEVILADHMIVADDDFVSLVESKYYNPYETYYNPYETMV